MMWNCERVGSRSGRSPGNQACLPVSTRVLWPRRGPARFDVDSIVRLSGRIFARIRAVVHKRLSYISQGLHRINFANEVEGVRTTPQSLDREGAVCKNYELSVSVVGIRGNEQLFVSS